MGKLNSKVALVTGAASGIGRDVCYKFLEEDCVVIAADVDATALDALKNEAPGKGLRLHVIQCDITKERELETLVSAAIREQGHIDILVNNAGIMDNFEAVADVSNSQWDRIMNVNLKGPFMLMRLLIPHFLHHKYGNIIKKILNDPTSYLVVKSIVNFAKESNIKMKPPLNQGTHQLYEIEWL